VGYMYFIHTHKNTYIYMHICIYKYILLAAYYLGSEHEDIGRYIFKLNVEMRKCEMAAYKDGDENGDGYLSALAHQMGQIFYC